MGVKYLDAETLRNEGSPQEANRKFFHPLGLVLELSMEDGTLEVWDCREDPEGIYFGGIDLKPKASSVERLSEGRADARQNLLGYWIQPSG